MAKIKNTRKNLQQGLEIKMITNIQQIWDIDNKKSFMIGDNKTDKLAAKKSKLKYYYAERNFTNN